MEHRQPRLQFVGTVSAVVLAVTVGCAPHDTYIRARVGDQPMSSFSSPLAQLGLVDGNFDIQGFHLIRPQTEELLFVSFPDPRTERRWRLRGAGRGAWAAYFVRETPTDNIESYHTVESLGGTVAITRFDPKRHIVEGTFEFDGALARRRGPRHSPDTLHVRSGAFRVRYDVVPAEAHDHRGRD